MAIAFDAQLGSNQVAATATTITLTTANTVASGGFIVLLVGNFITGTPVVSSVSGGGLTWAVDKTVKNSQLGIGLASAQAPAGLASGTVLTATYSATTTSRGISGVSFTGIATSTPVDATASATPATGTAWNGGGVVTTNANDVVVGAAMGDAGAGTTSTPGAGWTEVPTTAGDFNSGASGDSWTLVYQIVAATGTYTPSGTWLASQTTNGGVGVAYKAAAGGAVTVKNLAALGVG